MKGAASFTFAAVTKYSESGNTVSFVTKFTLIDSSQVAVHDFENFTNVEFETTQKYRKVPEKVLNSIKSLGTLHIT